VPLESWLISLSGLLIVGLLTVLWWFERAARAEVNARLDSLDMEMRQLRESLGQRVHRDELAEFQRWLTGRLDRLEDRIDGRTPPRHVTGAQW